MVLLQCRLPKAQALEGHLRSRVVGQEEAIAAIVDAWETWEAGLAPGDAPACSLMFIGPTGCGKTYLPLVTAEYLAGSERALLRIDCGEYAHGHEVAKLVGAPPGYLGHRETRPLLSPENLRANHKSDTPLMFILFDEIDKAGPEMVSLLLGLTGSGRITLGDNRTLDLRNCMIFFTGNTGTQEAERAKRYGYAPVSGQVQAAVYMSALRKRFTPEFLNRMTRIVVFNELSDRDLEVIAMLETSKLLERYIQAGGDSANVVIGPGFYRHVAMAAAGWGGARAIRRELNRALLLPMARSLKSGCGMRVFCSGGEIRVEEV